MLKQRLKNCIHLIQSIYGNIIYGFPARKLKIYAVTGSDGKTTTTSMLFHVLNNLGFKAGYISTTGAMIGGKELNTGLHVTTPDPWVLPKYLSMMVKKDVDYVILETTSSGLDQNRLWGIKFSGGIITNIKSDHLDYHKTWSNYAKAKFKMVDQLRLNAPLIINKEDKKSYNWLKKQLKTNRQDLKVKEIEVNKAHDVKFSLKGIEFTYRSEKIRLSLIGQYNLENVLGVISLLETFIPISDIAKSLISFSPPKGRMEVVKSSPFFIIVDFAHNPNSLEHALTSLVELKTKTQRLIVIFGCAGKRDSGRREMGLVASKFADIIILTAEDPRDENLFDINTKIIEFSKKGKGELISRIANHKAYTNTKLSTIKTLIDTTQKLYKVPIIAFDENSVNSRQDAIDLGIRLAEKGDIVFTTGKAHEQSLAFGDNEQEFPWDEHKAIKESLDRAGMM